MQPKTEALQDWKLMMCAKMYTEDNLPDIPETNWTQVGDCITPDGIMKACGDCRYYS